VTVSHAQSSNLDSVFLKKKTEKKSISFFTLDSEYSPATVTVLKQCIMRIDAFIHPQKSTVSLNLKKYMDEGLKVPVRNYMISTLSCGGIAIGRQ
jgi:hypothetical protein